MIDVPAVFTLEEDVASVLWKAAALNRIGALVAFAALVVLYYLSC